MRDRYPFILALTTVLALGSVPGAHATTFSYIANLSGLNEVPPNASPGVGTAFLVYDDVANTLTTSITFSGMLAPLTASHIHGPATPTTNAGVLHGFVTPALTAGSYSDVWTGLSSGQVGYLQGQQLYINLHTGVYPGGEIRGMIVPEATPTRAASWGRIKSLYR